MEERYAVYYRNLYERHWWWRAREDVILQTLLRLRPEQGWGHILDVGCGDGLFLPKLAELGDVEGIEMDPAGVNPANPWLPRIHIRPFDETFQPGTRYRLITMCDVLEHFPDPVRRLKLALSLLEPEGTLLITVPSFRWLWTTHDTLNRHYTRYTRRRLAEEAHEAGGRLAESRYLFQWMVPLKLAVKLKEAVLRSAPENPPIPGPVINGILYRMARTEERLLRGSRLPIGSSLIAVVKP